MKPDGRILSGTGHIYLRRSFGGERWRIAQLENSFSWENPSIVQIISPMFMKCDAPRNWQERISHLRVQWISIRLLKELTRTRTPTRLNNNR